MTSRTAVVLPGGQNGPAAPLPMFASDAAEQRGGRRYGGCLWDSALARELTPYVLEVPGADHGMYVPGRLAASAEVLGQVATAVEDFLDQVVWSPGPTAGG